MWTGKEERRSEPEGEKKPQKGVRMSKPKRLISHQASREDVTVTLHDGDLHLTEDKKNEVFLLKKNWKWGGVRPAGQKTKCPLKKLDGNNWVGSKDPGHGKGTS